MMEWKGVRGMGRKTVELKRQNKGWNEWSEGG
jgi:hypothetical protein